jgi:ABC-type phosphate/phosphonate transport system substrate-binding protein
VSVRGVVVFGVALAVLAATARGQESDRFLVCYPNAPGSARSAGPIMEKLGEYLGDRLGRRMSPVYFNDLSRAQAWLGQAPARHGILSLPLYLAWRKAKKLRVVAHAKRNGGALERYHLLVTTNSPCKTFADLLAQKAPRIWSPHLDDARFATNVLFARKLIVKEVQRGKQVSKAFAKGTVRVVSTTKTLGALRRMQAGKPYKGQPVDAVLVDDTFWAGLQKLKRFKGVLRVLYASPELPTAPVVSFPGAPAAESAKLTKVLLAMGDDVEGKAILKTLQATGFGRPQDKALEALAAQYAAEIK